MESRHKKRPASGVAKAAYLLGVLVRKVAVSMPPLPKLFARDRSDDDDDDGDQYGDQGDFASPPPKRSRRQKRLRRDARTPRHRSAPPQWQHAEDSEQDDSISELGRALTDPDPLVRAVALETVGDFEGNRAGRLLAAVLHDSDPRVRCAAAAAAARANATGAVFSLILSLDDDNRDVRLAAATAIQTITGERIDSQSFDDAEARVAIIEELKVWWKKRRFAELATTGEDDFD